MPLWRLTAHLQCVGAALALLSLPVMGQSPNALPASGAPSQYQHATDAPSIRAIRTAAPIVIDGRPDEAAWMTAPALTELWQVQPQEGAPASHRTEVRFLYDSENLYVGAWLWDESPTSHHARRDASVPESDRFAIYLDTHHDHRTAYRFLTNPSGMKKDEIVTGMRQGGGSDLSWDPVWEVRTSLTDWGWHAEMRIPFSQLRYNVDDVQIWGLQVERTIRRLNEETFWAFTPRRERGGVARMGHLEGIEGITRGRGLELLPYVSGRAEYTRVLRSEEAQFDNPFRSGSDYFGNIGVDLKYRLASDLALAATLNPDFGQVEVDPAVINLTAFETRFEERRPFFVEGADIFRFGEGGVRPGPKTPQLLYSRRMGGSPRGESPGTAVYSETPSAAAILAAVKVTGRTAGGWSLGALDVTTRRETALFVDQTGLLQEAPVEPLSNYFAGRVRRDLREGTASIGFIGTAVHRNFADPELSSRLSGQAYAAGLDGRLEWSNRTWVLSGELSPSYVTGEAGAIDRLQRSSARYLHRPDARHLPYDSMATSLTGSFSRVDLSKVAGEWQGQLEVTTITPRYEVNDIGFQTSADRLYVDSDLGYEQTRPGRHLRRWGAHLLPTASWNLGGDLQSLNLGVSGTGQLLSFHTFNWRFERQFAAWDDRLTRGGPMTRGLGGYSAAAGGGTTFSRPIQLRGNMGFSSDEAGGWSRNARLSLTFRVKQMYDVQIGPEFSRSHTAAQYVASVADPLAEHTNLRRYLFAPLDQTTVSMQMRFNAAFSQDLTFEMYAQPLLSTGDYGDLMELAAPRTFEFHRYADIGTIERTTVGSYLIDPDGPGPAGEFQTRDLTFNSRSLIGNAVLRWEWRPGSTLFLVWQQSRNERLTPGAGDAALRRTGGFRLDGDTRALFGIEPSNVFLVKLNYWLSP